MEDDRENAAASQHVIVSWRNMVVRCALCWFKVKYSETCIVLFGCGAGDLYFTVGAGDWIHVLYSILVVPCFASWSKH